MNYYKTTLQGRRVLFSYDQEDHAFIMRFSWYADGKGYIRTCYRGLDGVTIQDSLHRMLLKPKGALVVDHKNGHKWDNRRCNLRICTKAENNRNAKTRVDSSSGVKGVYWNHRTEKWVVSITFDGRVKYLGTFKDSDDAVLARIEAEAKYFGEFSRKDEFFT
jgi:hypothetical protein